MGIRSVYINDLVERGYFWSVTILLRQFLRRCMAGETDLPPELMLNRN
ncbi:MAG: hypothetical protein U9R33_02910 [candidate division NC10 bacterium]|nr:hypothetical protein [candidate division NC10 bacterium]